MKLPTIVSHYFDPETDECEYRHRSLTLLDGLAISNRESVISKINFANQNDQTQKKRLKIHSKKTTTIFLLVDVESEVSSW